MLVPEMLCGDTRTVATASKKHLARFRKGASWIDAGPLREVRDAPGLLMVDGPSPLLSGDHVRLYAPFREFNNAIVRRNMTFEANTRAIEEALGCAWSLLGLLAVPCYRWFRDTERAGRFLEAIMGHWSEIEKVGARYSNGLPVGVTLWELAHLLKYILAHRGVATVRLSEPLPRGGIAALLMQTA